VAFQKIAQPTARGNTLAGHREGIRQESRDRRNAGPNKTGDASRRKNRKTVSFHREGRQQAKQAGKEEAWRGRKKKEQGAMVRRKHSTKTVP